MKRILVLLLLLSVSISFAQTKVGTTAANFLAIPVGPRASGMGGAFVATANDATALYWNVGGISRMTENELGVSYSQWLLGTNYNWIGLVYKVDENNTVGFSINQLDYGQEDVTTVDYPNGTGEKWSAQDLAIAVSYGRNLTDRFSIGGSVKYIHQQIYRESASAFALDVGLLFNTQLDGLRIGMNIANFGSEMKLDGQDLIYGLDIDHKSGSGNNEYISSALTMDSWTLPLLFTVGLAYDAVKTSDIRVTVASDAVYPNNTNSFINVGGEACYDDLFFVRVGYNSLFKQEAIERLCAGVGFKYDFGAVKTKIDYSYQDFKDGLFTPISKVSLTIGF